MTTAFTPDRTLLADLLADERSRRQGWDLRHSFRTGFNLLDDVIEDGFRSGDLVLVGGAPGVGKTIATLQWARHMAGCGVPVAFICYEHSQRSLLARLLHVEVAEEVAAPASGDGALRRLIRAAASGRMTLELASASEPRLARALGRLEHYANSLSLIRGTARTDVAAIDAIGAGMDGQGVVFVDYLQKVPSGESGPERAGHTAEMLKTVAMERNLVMVAVSAGDASSLTDRRVRLHDLKGAETLAYEADVVIVLNEKLRAVSRLHTAFDTVKAQGFRNKVVFTVEKNRDGIAPVDVEFTKHFAQYRFDPIGDAVAERLVDGVTLD